MRDSAETMERAAQYLRKSGHHMTVDGENASRGVVEFVIKINFHCLPYVIRELNKAWAEERKERIREIERINSALPNAQEVS